MELVANGEVTQEWDKSKWIQTEGGTFYCACVTYKGNREDPIDVCFTEWGAFVIEDEDGELFTVADYKEEAEASGGSEAFEYLDGFEQLVFDGEIVDDVVEKYGLSEYKDDILAHAKDLLWVSEEVDA